MLIRFSLHNFKSINEEVTLSLAAQPLRQRTVENTIKTNYRGLNLLKAVVMHGANASGKTNILNGLLFMRQFVLESSTLQGQEIDTEPYRLIYGNLESPSRFEIEIIVNDQRFVYGFEVNKSRIHSEWLDVILKTTKKPYFKRKFDEIEIDQSFREGYERRDLVRSDALFLSTIGQFNGHISLGIIDWFRNSAVITEYNIASNTSFTAFLLRKPKYKALLLKIFKEAKLEIEDVEIEEINIDNSLIKFLGPELLELVRKQNHKQLKIWTKHRVFDEHGQLKESVRFELREESAGTQKFFAIAGPLLNSLINGYPIFIDELDSKMHVKLVQFVIGLFCDGINNIGNGQLICINHTTSPLSSGILRRDQIILISKDSKKGTRIKSLYDNDVRSDSSFEKDYLKGEYGGIPEIRMNQLRLFGYDFNT